MVMDQVDRAGGGVMRALHRDKSALVMSHPWDSGTARFSGPMGGNTLTTTSAVLAFALDRLEDGARKDDVVARCPMIVSMLTCDGFDTDLRASEKMMSNIRFTFADWAADVSATEPSPQRFSQLAER